MIEFGNVKVGDQVVHQTSSTIPQQVLFVDADGVVVRSVTGTGLTLIRPATAHAWSHYKVPPRVPEPLDDRSKVWVWDTSTRQYRIEACQMSEEKDHIRQANRKGNLHFKITGIEVVDP